METRGLTQKYVDAHLERVQSIESFGRAVIERVARIARERAKGENVIEVDMQFTVEVVPPQDGGVAKPGCMRVCTGSGTAKTCYHVSD